MIVTWHASMFGRYFSSHSGVRFSIPVRPHTSRLTPPLSSRAVANAAAISSLSAVISPEPMWQPIRAAGNVVASVESSNKVPRVSSPASSAASLAAPTASSTSRAITFTALR